MSVFPILYMEKIMNFVDFKYLNIFHYVSKIKDFLSSLELSLSLSLFLLIIVLASFLFG
ncbi:MAG: hypothetical protein LBC61_04615 [Candidatus Peribacteria bacterium]|nr:hypothetical protein [Candidatus Peribacteria bacterium]